VRGGFDLSCPSDKPVTLNARWGATGLIAQVLGLFFEALI
jgi:hypothetical protein